MFDIGWSEMAIIAVVTLVVLGPKELPHALKTFSHWMRAARKLGNEFQSGVNEIVRDAELEDARRELQKISRQSLEKKIEQVIDPAGEIKKSMNTPLDAPQATAATGTVSPAVSPPEAVPAEPAPASSGGSEQAAPSTGPETAPVATDPATGAETQVKGAAV